MLSFAAAPILRVGHAVVRSRADTGVGRTIVRSRAEIRRRRLGSQRERCAAISSPCRPCNLASLYRLRPIGTARARAAV